MICHYPSLWCPAKNGKLPRKLPTTKGSDRLTAASITMSTCSLPMTTMPSTHQRLLLTASKTPCRLHHLPSTYLTRDLLQNPRTNSGVVATQLYQRDHYRKSTRACTQKTRLSVHTSQCPQLEKSHPRKNKGKQ